MAAIKATSPGAHVERLPEPSGQATVVLDIGGSRGAAVVYLTADWDGSEVEIRSVGDPWTGTHTAVRRRDLQDGSCFAAVFGSLAAGDYQLRIRGSDSDPVMGVSVDAGHVTEASWPADPHVVAGTATAPHHLAE